jgi:hypothetical protein
VHPKYWPIDIGIHARAWDAEANGQARFADGLRNARLLQRIRELEDEMSSLSGKSDSAETIANLRYEMNKCKRQAGIEVTDEEEAEGEASTFATRELGGELFRKFCRGMHMTPQREHPYILALRWLSRCAWLTREGALRSLTGLSIVVR